VVGLSAADQLSAVGFDVTKLSAAQLEAAGVLLAKPPIDLDGSPLSGKTWISHAEYARRAPEHDERARSYARLLAYLHLERQYIKVGCPKCGRGEGRPCKHGPQGQYKQRPAIGYSHSERREAAEAEGVSLCGLQLQQRFPCAGQLRELERSGNVLFVQCDVCGAELGVAPPLPGKHKNEKPLGEDDIPL